MRLTGFVCLAALLVADAAEAAPLQIVAEDYAPATFMANDAPTGIDVDVAKAVFDHLGVAYEIKLMPWARAWEMLKAGDADVGLHVSVNDERAPYVRWPKNSVWNADFVFMTNAETKKAYDFTSYDEVKKAPVEIGIINGNSYDMGFWAAFPSPDRANQHYYQQLQPVADAATNLRKLDANRIQLFPIARILGVYQAHQMHLGNVTAYDWVLFSKPYPNAFADHSKYSDAKYPTIAALMQAYDDELGRLKSNPAEYQKFIDRYQ